MAKNIISIEKMTFAFPNERKALFKNFDIEIAQGSLTTLMGPSGCGKSTLLRLMMGLLEPKKGTITIHSQNDEKTKRRAFMFQDARLLPWRSALDNVIFSLEAFPMSTEERRSRAMEKLNMVHLTDCAGKLPHQLSGGQCQRVAIARALAVEPDLLLMDEPFSALDSYARHDLQDVILEIWEKTKKTIVFVTHDKHEAYYLSDRIVLLDNVPVTVASDTKVTAPRPREW